MEKHDTPLERAVERLTALATDLDYAAMPTKPDVVTLCGGYAAEARDDLRLILSANREMREMLDLYRVGVLRAFDGLCDTCRGGAVISEQTRSALTTQRGDGE